MNPFSVIELFEPSMEFEFRNYKYLCVAKNVKTEKILSRIIIV